MEPQTDKAGTHNELDDTLASYAGPAAKLTAISQRLLLLFRRRVKYKVSVRFNLGYGKNFE